MSSISDEPYQLTIFNRAQRDIKKLDHQMRDRILSKISSLREQPRPSGTKKLKGYDDAYRVRVGDYRVLYEVDDDDRAVDVFGVPHRSDAY